MVQRVNGVGEGFVLLQVGVLQKVEIKLGDQRVGVLKEEHGPILEGLHGVELLLEKNFGKILREHEEVGARALRKDPPGLLNVGGVEAAGQMDGQGGFPCTLPTGEQHPLGVVGPHKGGQPLPVPVGIGANLGGADLIAGEAEEGALRVALAPEAVWPVVAAAEYHVNGAANVCPDGLGVLFPGVPAVSRLALRCVL